LAAEQASLAEVLTALRRRWLVALLAAAALFGGVLAYAEQLPAEYSAEAVVAFAPPANAVVGGDVITIILPKYVAFGTAPSTLRAVARSTGVPERTLKDAVSVSVATQTANVTIDVQLESPRTAAAVAGELADRMVSMSATGQLLQGTIVSPPVVPEAPSGPPRRLIELAGLVVALAVGLLLAYAIERTRPKIHSGSEVTRLTTWPVIGRLPRSKAVRRELPEALADPQVGAAMRGLRTVLDTELQSAPVQAIAITSAQPGDGKTSVASALGGAIARLNARVLIIDADTRRARLTTAYGGPDTVGLADVAEGRIDLDRATQPTSVPGLFVLPCAPGTVEGDVLALRLPGLLGRAKQVFDVVLVDTAPLLVGDEAATVATSCDAVLVVVGVGSATGPLHEAAFTLESLGAQVVGVVLNNARPTRFSYGYY
jgi:capsular exopolysaccharide synthesis family protein